MTFVADAAGVSKPGFPKVGGRSERIRGRASDRPAR
jgi:hypothetical protein